MNPNRPLKVRDKFSKIEKKVSDIPRAFRIQNFVDRSFNLWRYEISAGSSLRAHGRPVVAYDY
jgi:hypothetical protein